MSINEIVTGWVEQDAPPEALTAALVDREENIADIIRLAGAQFGLFPGIVSKVLMDAGLGAQKSDAEVEYINTQFAEALAALQRMIDEQNGGGGQ